MSEPEPKTPQERLRRIEEETAQLDRDIDEAREAVHRAGQADSMAYAGDAQGQGSVGAVGGDAEDEEPSEDDGDDDDDEKDRKD